MERKNVGVGHIGWGLNQQDLLIDSMLGRGKNKSQEWLLRFWPERLDSLEQSLSEKYAKKKST